MNYHSIGWSRRGSHLGASLLVAILVSACGGGGSGPAPQPPPDPVITPAQGQLLSATRLSSIPAADIASAIAQAGTRAPNVTPRYEVQSWRINYRTLDGAGQLVEASGLVSVPQKPANASSPLLSYQHGTTWRDAEAPSNHAVAAEPAIVMASTGYIVIAPDYVGYGASKGKPHPYLLAAPSAAAVLDLLSASKTWRSAQNLPDNGQLFMAGYSEGGYVTMAAHRALQAGSDPHKTQLVAVVTGAGPYHVSATLDELLRRVRDENPLLAAVLSPGLLKNLSSSLRQQVRDLLLEEVQDDDDDVKIQPNFIDYYLADDQAALDQHSNVHDWKPEIGVKLYHGRDDQTVPYLSASSTVKAMQARGAGAQISLSDCTAQPASHLGCVLPYWNFMLGEIGTLARNL